MLLRVQCTHKQLHSYFINTSNRRPIHPHQTHLSKHPLFPLMSMHPSAIHPFSFFFFVCIRIQPSFWSASGALKVPFSFRSCPCGSGFPHRRSPFLLICEWKTSLSESIYDWRFLCQSLGVPRGGCHPDCAFLAVECIKAQKHRPSKDIVTCTLVNNAAKTQPLTNYSFLSVDRKAAGIYNPLSTDVTIGMNMRI